MADKSFLNDKKDIEWFKNFFYYYKIHITVIIFLILATVYTVHTIVTEITPDVSVNVVGGAYITEDSRAKFKDYFTPKINDYDGKDGKVIEIVQKSSAALAGEDADLEVVINQTVTIELAVGESYLYIINDKYINDFIESGVLTDLSTIAPDLQKNTFAMRIENNKLFKELVGTTSEPLYLCVRDVVPSVRKSQLETAKAMHENAKIMFNEFYKNQ